MTVHLRDVQLTDLDAYVRMRCDPVMTAEFGGPLPRERVEAKIQGQGWGRRAVSTLLGPARDDGPWGPVHVFPPVTNAASNARCRSTGFCHLGARELTFRGRVLRCNTWRHSLDLP